MKKNKPLLVKNQSNASDSTERTAHRSAAQSQASSSSGLSERSVDRSATQSAAQSPVSTEVGRIISQLGGIEGITKTIGSIQSLIQTIAPLLPLLGFAPREQKGIRKASISPQNKQKVKRKK